MNWCVPSCTQSYTDDEWIFKSGYMCSPLHTLWAIGDISPFYRQTKLVGIFKFWQNKTGRNLQNLKYVSLLAHKRDNITMCPSLHINVYSYCVYRCTQKTRKSTNVGRMIAQMMVEISNGRKMYKRSQKNMNSFSHLLELSLPSPIVERCVHCL